MTSTPCQKEDCRIILSDEFDLNQTAHTSDAEQTSEAVELGPRHELEAACDTSYLLTPAMMAEVLKISVRSIRRWHRAGLLESTKTVMQLPHFDYSQVTRARQLSKWMQQGLAVHSMQQQLHQLQLRAGNEQSFEALPILAEGKRLVLRQGDTYIEAGGQLHFGFESPDAHSTEKPATIRFHPAEVTNGLRLLEGSESEPSTVAEAPPDSLEAMIELAVNAEDAEDLDAAIGWYRTALSAFGPNPDVCFQLAELLYRLGDLGAARERYFMALEIQPTLVEARANLGCVLAELGQIDLAIAAFRGTLEQFEDYADVHLHLARALDDSGQPTAAIDHWQRFLELAPSSPWADEAAERLAQIAPLLDF